MTNSYRKEYPFAGFAGFGGGVGALSVKSAASKPYVDDVFSTYVYKGNSSTQSITNGIDISGKGGLVWIKGRDDTVSHFLYDTARGAGVQLNSDNNTDEHTDTSRFSSFNSDGFSLGNNAYTNDSSYNYSSWTFAKQKGFFDIVTFTGNGSVRTISHGLGSIPGLIMIKNLDSVNSWFTYHRDLGPSAYVMLNHTNAENTGASWFMNDTSPTATEFTLGTGGNVNESGDEFVAYLFAGGASTTDKAVDFDGDDYLTMPVSNTDFDWGASDSLTIECFLNLDDVSSMAYNSIINRWAGSNYSFGLDVKNNGNLFFYFGSGTGSINTAESSGTTISTNTWYHVAVVKDGTTGRFFIDGKACGTFTWNLASSNSSQTLHVGNLGDGNVYDIDGELSNVRMTMGQALYTTNFNVPHDPLTTTSQGAIATNVKLLCCNQATTTGSTVAPGTITANGDPTVTTNSSIFDDTAAHIFGEDGDKGIIKTGIYTGNGSDDGPEINLGFEPQWIMLKRTDSTDNWPMYDVMRGITTFGTDNQLRADQNAVEHTTGTTVDVTSTGFNITTLGSEVNASNGEYVYIAIRRPDGYVGKPPSAGTDVFGMAYGTGTNPAFAPGFPVDFTFLRRPGTTENWTTAARLIQGKYLHLNQTAAEATDTDIEFDHNNGFHDGTGFSTYLSWSWKRGAGFDVVSWTGTNSSVVRRHNLGTTPEMIWYKNRSSTRDWKVYHKGLNGGTNPEDYDVEINTSNAEANNTSYMTSTAPTSTTFVAGNDDDTNGAGSNYIAMLFASANDADGNPISKVGYYTGTGSNQSVTTGFQPRFILIKRTTYAEDWYMFDSVRGLVSGSPDPYLRTNDTAAQTTTASFFDISSTGFTVSNFTNNANTYIYYAHA